MELLNELISLNKQVQEVGLQDKLGEQNPIHYIEKEVFEQDTDTIENTSENLTKTLTETFKENNKALVTLNKKLWEIMSDRGIIAIYLLCPLYKITYFENTRQFKSVKDSTSNRVDDLLLHKTIPIIFHNKLLTFRDTGKEFELKGDLLIMMTIKRYNVDLASLPDKQLMFDFAKDLNFDIKRVGNKSTRDRTLIKLLRSPGLMVSASGFSKKSFSK